MSSRSATSTADDEEPSRRIDAEEAVAIAAEAVEVEDADQFEQAALEQLAIARRAKQEGF